MALTQIKSEGIKDSEVKNADMADDAVGVAELSATGTASSSTFLRGDNSWVTPTDTNTVYTHPNHSGEVTSTADGATVIADDIVDEANLKISNAGSNGQFLSKQSGNTGGLTWATVDTTLADNSVTLAKMAGLARGKIIYGDASGDPAALTVGSASTYLKSDGTDVSWASLSSPMFAAGKVALITHETGANTSGGSFSSGSYVTVPFTNERYDPGGIVSLSSNEITFGPGTYQMFCWHTCYKVDASVCALKITSASGDHYWGTGTRTGSSTVTHENLMAQCRHVNDTGGDETMILTARCDTTRNSDGWGTQNGFGAGHVWGQWWILKEA